jgi:hypothetical protein
VVLGVVEHEGLAVGLAVVEGVANLHRRVVGRRLEVVEELDHLLEPLLAGRAERAPGDVEARVGVDAQPEHVDVVAEVGEGDRLADVPHARRLAQLRFVLVLLFVDLEEDEAAIARTNDEVDVGVLLLAGHEVAREGAAVVEVDFADELTWVGHDAALEGLRVPGEDERVLHGLFLLLLALDAFLGVPTLFVGC